MRLREKSHNVVRELVTYNALNGWRYDALMRALAIETIILSMVVVKREAASLSTIEGN